MDLSKRNIRTDYSFRGKLLKTTRSLYANNAVPNCVNHMQFNHYEASVAEVYDENTGDVHAVITRNIHGKMVIVLKREIREDGRYRKT